MQTTNINIKLERIRRNMNQLDVAKELGISEVTYRKKEKNGGFTDKELCKLADLFKTTVDYLLGR